MERMERSWLVQRLKRPFKDGTSKFFVFGIRGGFSEKELEMVSKVFRFDYMGSAEFEWGTVPNTLAKIWDDKNKIAFETVVTTKNKKSGIVYVICNNSMAHDIEEWIKHKGYDDYDNKYLTKERVMLQDAIDNFGKDDERPFGVCGWIELDNGFFFFTDQEIFENTKEMLCMGMFDTVTDVPVICPKCGNKERKIAQIKSGPQQLKEYKFGVDKIDLNWDYSYYGAVVEKIDESNGKIIGLAECYSCRVHFEVKFVIKDAIITKVELFDK